MSKKLIKMAIAYDFDGTLAKGNIQENSFIPTLGISKKEFWTQASKIGKKHNMDSVLAYMYLIVKLAKDKNINISKKALKEHGKTAQYFEGVEQYFKKINKYAKSKGVELEHYIISSGNKEMLEGTTIAKEFKKIYACSFMYEKDVPVWPAIALNYTSKTQFLFRINKGIKNDWDNNEINQHLDHEKRPIPFEHIIFIGDGKTDVPAMRIVKSQGGHSIGVYPPGTKKPSSLLEDGRVHLLAKSDYTENSKLYKSIQNIIDKIAINEKLK